MQMARLIDGKAWAALSRRETRERASALEASGVTPGLAVILVGDNPASHSYVRGKERAARETGISSEVFRLAASTVQEEVLALIDRLNGDARVHGILVQLPLPDHMDTEVILAAVSPQKDVDGFHALNVGALSLGREAFVPCTPLGIMKLLAYEAIDLRGRHAAIVGRSNIVGKPMAQLLLQADATVTICHSRTRGLAEITRQADILVAAVGRPEMITGDMVHPGTVVIDVGINRVADRLVGDVEFASVSRVAGAITPVPGGVGPMTIAMLLHNTVKAAQATLRQV